MGPAFMALAIDNAHGSTSPQHVVRSLPGNANMQHLLLKRPAVKFLAVAAPRAEEDQFVGEED